MNREPEDLPEDGPAYAMAQIVSRGGKEDEVKQGAILRAFCRSGDFCFKGLKTMAEKSGKIIFVIGGAKSGKSSFALESARAFPGRKAYVASAEPLDDEMRDRIEKHKAQRGKDWVTFEEPIKMAQVLNRIGDEYSTAVIDCLTLWLSNLLLGGDAVDGEVDVFLAFLRERDCPTLFIVSNEVGMGIVPDNALSRKFRDLAGNLNQKVAAIADEVYLVTAGIPLRIKP
jgi:adenosylcobinamide kinase / adenosylcobinamide-phosphate guanylyltransferase